MDSSGGGHDAANGSLTCSVVVTCLMAAFGGLTFGYDIGVSGGVTAMEPFLQDFFPEVLKKMASSKPNEYCIYDNFGLTSFTSSFYLAGLAASLVASKVTEAIGRQKIMLIGGILFFVGSAINAAAVNIAMLIIGRMLLGFGVGFTYQATPVYIAEMSPAKYRGLFTGAFQLFNGVGVLGANLINYFDNHLRWGWRLSLGMAAAPAIIVVFGSIFNTDTPSSLLQRGKDGEARAALQRIRGSGVNIEAEMKGIIQAVEDAKQNEDGAFQRLLRREYRPHLVMAVAIPAFMQLTGIIIVAFFSPLLFRTVGFGSDGALIGATLLGSLNLSSTLISTFTMDKCGRKVSFMAGGLVMTVTQVAVAWLMAVEFYRDGDAPMTKGYAQIVLALVCIFAFGFGFSWGPLSFLVPGEIFPVEIRSAAQGLSTAVGLGCTFVQTQTFLTMLCAFKYGTFLYYSGWMIIMTVFVAVFLPETKGIPLESMGSVWTKHWYWRRFVSERIHPTA